MSERWKVFWCEPTDRERRWLRRYASSNDRKCAKTGSYCNAKYPLPDADILYTAEGLIDGTRGEAAPPNEDPRWPTACEACGVAFAADDPHQLFGRQFYVRPDTGERFTLEEAPIGACWNAWWIAERRLDCPTGCGYFLGDDRRSLVVKLPFGHEWMIDSRASNCTKPNDNTHHCWVRTGTPEDGTLHVDKNGNTCAAGAGSIQTDKWHGFLHNGYLHT